MVSLSTLILRSGRTRITFPANTTVNETIDISWSIGSSSWRGVVQSGETPYWQFLGVSSASLTFGGVDYSPTNANARHYDGSQSFFDVSNPANAGWPQRMWWRVESGSGLSFSGSGIGSAQSGNFPSSNSQSLLASQNSLPVLFDMNVASPAGSPTQNGQNGTGAATSGTASFTLSGTTGSSGCTISFFLGWIVSNARRVGWAPSSLSGLSGSQTLYDYTANNSNNYAVTINSNSVPANGDTEFASNQASATNSYAITATVPQRRFTITNNRTETTHPHQSGLNNVVMTVNGVSAPTITSLASGASSSYNFTGTTQTGSWAARVNGVSDQSISSTSVTNSVTGFGGSAINITRGTAEALNASSNTGTGADTTVAGIDVDSTTNNVARSINTATTWAPGDSVLGLTTNDTGMGNMDQVGLTITANTIYARVTYNTGSVFVRGPAWQSGDSISGYTGAGATWNISAADLAAASQVSAGSQTIGVLPSNGASLVGAATGRIEQTPASTNYDIKLTNNNPYAVSLSNTSTGGARTLSASGGSHTATGLSSNSWTVASTYINDTGTGDGYAGGFGVSQSSGTQYTGTLSNGTGTSAQSGSASSIITIGADTSTIVIGNTHPDANGGQSSRTVSWSSSNGNRYKDN